MSEYSETFICLLQKIKHICYNEHCLLVYISGDDDMHRADATLGRTNG